MAEIVEEIFAARGILTKDANASTGGGDFIERILGLIGATGFTVAIFSLETRANAMANITLELGFAAMCGKPLVIVKSKEAENTFPPHPDGLDRIRRRQRGALPRQARPGARHDRGGRRLPRPPARHRHGCRGDRLRHGARACQQGLSADKRSRLIDKAEHIAARIEGGGANDSIADLERLKGEVAMFVRQSRAAISPPKATCRRDESAELGHG